MIVIFLNAYALIDIDRLTDYKKLACFPKGKLNS